METREEFKLNRTAMEVQNSSIEETPQAKGTANNPFTVAEFEDALATDSWQGGYVEHIGLVAAETNTSNFNTGYGYYSGFQFDINNYQGNSQHRQGTIDAFYNNETTCAYNSISHFVKISGESVADLYNDWLIYQKKQSTEDGNISTYDLDVIRKEVAGGMTETNIAFFLKDILPNFGLFSISTKDKNTIKDQLEIKAEEPNEDENKVRAIGIVTHNELGETLYHAVKVKYIKDEYLDYVDPNPNNTKHYRASNLSSAFIIKKIQRQ